MRQPITVNVTAETDADVRALLGALLVDNPGWGRAETFDGYVHVFDQLVAHLDEVDRVNVLASLLFQSCVTARLLVLVLERRAGLDPTLVMGALDEISGNPSS